MVSAISQILGIGKLHISKERNLSERKERRIWPGYADSMIGNEQLDNLQFCIETVLRDGVEGDLIETGVWRGGACILMRAVLAAYGIRDRKVFVADSFEGLPRPDAGKYPADKNDSLYKHPLLAVSREHVENNFRKYGLLDEQVVFLQGWFKDTLPHAPIQKLSILRLDGDMYGSTMEALENLYSKLSKGGFCIIDDYALRTCAAAVNDFRSEHGIDSELVKIDWTGRYFTPIGEIEPVEVFGYPRTTAWGRKRSFGAMRSDKMKRACMSAGPCYIWRAGRDESGHWVETLTLPS